MRCAIYARHSIDQQKGAFPTPKKRANHCLLYLVYPKAPCGTVDQQ